MAISNAYAREWTAHATTLLGLVVDELQVPWNAEEMATALASGDTVWVPLRPAMRAFRVSRPDQRRLERDLAEGDDSDQAGWDRVTSQVPILCVSLAFLLAAVVRYGRHRACQRWVVWEIEVQIALRHHGWYDPATEHQPPAGEELQALEQREAMRDMLAHSFPFLAEYFDVHEARNEEDDHGDEDTI